MQQQKQESAYYPIAFLGVEHPFWIVLFTVVLGVSLACVAFMVWERWILAASGEYSTLIGLIAFLCFLASGLVLYMRLSDEPNLLQPFRNYWRRNMVGYFVSFHRDEKGQLAWHGPESNELIKARQKEGKDLSIVLALGGWWYQPVRMLMGSKYKHWFTGSQVQPLLDEWSVFPLAMPCWPLALRENLENMVAVSDKGGGRVQIKIKYLWLLMYRFVAQADDKGKNTLTEFLPQLLERGSGPRKAMVDAIVTHH